MGACVVALGLRISLPLGLTVGYVLAFVLIPVWVPYARRFVGTTALLVLVPTAVASGWWLTERASVDHATSTSFLVSLSVLLLGTVCGAGLLLWSREVLGGAWTAQLLGLGLLLSVPVSSEGFAANPWKAGFSLPLTLLLMGVAWRTGKTWPQVLVAVGLGAYSALNDSRSAFAFLLFAAAVLLWVRRRRGTSRRGSTGQVLLLVAVLGLVVYNLGQALILEGYLGEETKVRSAQQIATSGSILLGSRPEAGATIALMSYRPGGLGAGTIVNLEDLEVAKTGMAGLGYDPDNGYVERYMFGNHVELHSVLGDLWSWFGPAGVVLTVLIGVLVVRGVASAVVSSTVSALMVYCAARTLWDLLFSPFYTSATLVMLCLALLAVRRPGAPVGPGEWRDVARLIAQAGRWAGAKSQRSAARRPSSAGRSERTSAAGRAARSAVTTASART